jgi:glycosyltransferase involved in cell wall biosynthesis
MRIAFYAPMKPPTHGVPSGDRRVAGLLMEALGRAGNRVELASTYRSYDAHGDPQRQAAMRDQAREFARGLATQWQRGPSELRPELWFTYHVYYKAPDWLGPTVSASLGIPYVIAEASYAPKRAGGPWAIGHEAVGDSIRHAALVLSPTRYDIECVQPLLASPDRIELLPPFLDATPFRQAARVRAAHRTRLAEARGVDAAPPWIAVAAMMRRGDKLASYRALAAVLACVADLPWRLLVAGDGEARDEVRGALEAAVPGRSAYLGALPMEEVAALYAASDLCVWPAVNEAYGMALLEAQATGLPVVSCALRGVPDVVVHGRTGLLAPEGNVAALARMTRELLADAPRRAALGRAAAEHAGSERGLDAAAAQLKKALTRVTNQSRERSGAPHRGAA